MRQSKSTNPKDFARFNKERMSAYSHKHLLKKRFNLTVEEYKELLKNQNNKCAVCDTKHGLGTLKSRRLCVDHCHKTGKVRGLLCVNCNTTLGKVGDDVKHLEKLIKYLHENL